MIATMASEMNDENINEIDAQDQLQDTSESTSQEDISGLLNTVKKLRQENKKKENDLKNTLARLEKLQQIDPDAYNEAVRKSEIMEQAQLERQKWYNSEKSSWEQERSKLTSQIGELQSNMTELQIKHTLEKAFYAGGGRKGADKTGVTCFDIVYPQLRRCVQVDDNGRPIVVDPLDGSRKIDSKGNNLSVLDLINEIRDNEIMSAMFEADSASSGMGSSGRFKGSIKSKSAGEIAGDRTMDRAQRLQMIRNKSE